MKIAVIGGGPIGLMSALMLANRGHIVHVFEKGDWPKDKACGQGIMPSGVKALKKQGIEFNHGLDSFAFDGVSYIDGQRFLKGLTGQVGIGVERRILSSKLFEKAKSFKHIHLKPGVNWKGLKEDDDQIVCHFENHPDETYDYVFACDGLHSPVRKFLLNERTRSEPFRMGAREHFDTTPWSQQVEVYWQDGVEAYVTPVSNSRIEVTFLWFEDSIVNDGGREKLRNLLFDKFPQLRKKLNLESSSLDFKGHGPFKKVALKEKVGRVFFVGDSFKFLDGITGEGISLGLKGAELIVNHFQQWNYLHSLRLKFLYWHYSLMVFLALNLSRSLRLRSILMRGLVKVPQAFSLILRLNDFK